MSLTETRSPPAPEAAPTALETAAAVRTGGTTAREAAAAALARIARLDPELNAIIASDAERALAQAADVDRHAAAEQPQPGAQLEGRGQPGLVAHQPAADDQPAGEDPAHGGRGETADDGRDGPADGVDVGQVVLADGLGRLEDEPLPLARAGRAGGGQRSHVRLIVSHVPSRTGAGHA